MISDIYNPELSVVHTKGEEKTVNDILISASIDTLTWPVPRMPMCLCPTQCQAIVVGFLASVAAVVMGWIPEGHFDLLHALLLCAAALVTASLASLILSKYSSSNGSCNSTSSSLCSLSCVDSCSKIPPWLTTRGSQVMLLCPLPRSHHGGGDSPLPQVQHQPWQCGHTHRCLAGRPHHLGPPCLDCLSPLQCQGWVPSVRWLFYVFFGLFYYLIHAAAELWHLLLDVVGFLYLQKDGTWYLSLL